MLAGAAVVVPLAGQPTPEARPGGRLLSLAELLALPPPEWLIDGLLPAGGFAVLYGPPGSGKSFVALSWALAVSAGSPWLGRPVRQGAVLYIVAEGVAGMGVRARAVLRVEGYPEDLPIRFHPEAVDFSDERDVQQLLSDLRASGVTQWRLVVVDTLARCFGGGDENSAKDMNRFVAGVALLGKETRAAVVVVHHTGKDEGRGARGSNSLKAAADTEIGCGGGPPSVQLSCEKQKDAEPFEQIKLLLRPEKLAEGRSSCVVRPNTPEELLKMPPSAFRDKGSRPKTSSRKEDELEQMVALLPPEGLPHGEWRDRYCQDTGSESTFNRQLRDAMRSGRVTRSGEGRGALYVPKRPGAKAPERDG